MREERDQKGGRERNEKKNIKPESRSVAGALLRGGRSKCAPPHGALQTRRARWARLAARVELVQTPRQGARAVRGSSGRETPYWSGRL
eukprot:361689-Chlamydomonas_euryale.AAC.4